MCDYIYRLKLNNMKELTKTLATIQTELKAKKIGINGSSSYVRISQLKKQAVDKLIENVDHSQVIDFL